MDLGNEKWWMENVNWELEIGNGSLGMGNMNVYNIYHYYHSVY